MIPDTSFWRDGDTAMWVLGNDIWRKINEIKDGEIVSLDRPCDTCGGPALGLPNDDPRSMSFTCACSGTGRHTLDIVVPHPDGPCDHIRHSCDDIGCEGPTKTFRVHVIDVLPIYDHDELVNGDGLPRGGMTHIEWSELLDRFTLCEWNGGGWDETPITLPPDAAPGMWLVRLAIHS